MILTDGGDTASIASYDEMEAQARVAGIPIYVVAFSTDGDDNFNTQDVTRLRYLTTETGGFLTTATLSESLVARYADIEKDLRAQYAIRYQVADAAKPNEWRRVRVVLNSPRLTARTINGYFAP